MLKPHIPTYINNPWEKKVIEKPKIILTVDRAEELLFQLSGIKRKVTLVNNPQIVDFNSCHK